MNGFINVNKAEGVSSAREVGVIKRLTHTPCGHMGTLDPMASGVLPVAVGNACRLFDYFLTKSKTYIATFIFGCSYDTLDKTGKMTCSGGSIPSEEAIKEVIPSLVGDVMQVPPAYSAKSVGGRRGYELARRGVDFTLPPKKVVINSIELCNRVSENEFSFRIECGGGTYIRSIARDMAEKLNTFAAMSALQRTKSGPFEINNAVCTADLTEQNLSYYLIPTESLLSYDSYFAEGAEAKKLFNGISVPTELSEGIYKIYNNGDFYGLAAVEGGYLKVRTKLC